MKKRRFLVVGVIAVLALGFLGYRGFASGANYYYEVDELLAQQSSLVNENVRVSGLVAPGSIEQKGLTLRFDITGGTQSLPVVYEGAVPDSFRAGGEAVVEGSLNESGIFEAKVLMPKCASKYVAK